MLVVVSLAISASLAYLFGSRTIRQNLKQMMGCSAGLSKIMVDSLLDERRSKTEALAAYPLLRDPSSNPGAIAETLALSMQHWPIGLDACTVDTAGNILAATGRLSGASSASDSSWFYYAQTAQTTTLHLTNKNDLEALGYHEPVLATSTPLRDSNQQIFGYVVCFSSTADISKAITSIRLEERGHGFLLDEENRLIAGSLFTQDPSKKSGEERAIQALERKAEAGENEFLELPFDKADYLVTWEALEAANIPSPGLSWKIGVVVPLAEALAPLNSFTTAIIILAVAILAAAVAVSILLGRSILKPVNELVAGAERIGSGDLTGQLVIRSRDQIGKLAATLIGMRDNLRASTISASKSSDNLAKLAEDQAASAAEIFNNADAIAESAIQLSKNVEFQTQKIQKLLELAQQAATTEGSDSLKEALELLQQTEILAEVGNNKAVEITSAVQQLRTAMRDVSKAARRLSEMAQELKQAVRWFKT